MKNEVVAIRVNNLPCVIGNQAQLANQFVAINDQLIIATFIGRFTLGIGPTAC